MSRRAIAMTTAALVGGVAVAIIAVNAMRPLPAPELPTLELSKSPQLVLAPPVLASATTDARSNMNAFAERLDDLVGEQNLGGRVGIAVAELGGELVYEHNADEEFTPASTLKIVTCVAVLEVLGSDARFPTRVVVGDVPDEIVLVGGGDPTLTTGESAIVPGGTGLVELAEAAAASLASTETSAVRLTFDDSLFAGPAIDPDWEAQYVSSGVVAPVAALMVDGGRLAQGMATRADDPAQRAATEFATLLEEHGVEVDGAPERGEAAIDADPIAEIASAPLADIVEYVLATSNNDVAEVLARHVALGSDEPGTAAAAAPSVVDVLNGLGVDLTSQTVLDGSGLARGSAITPAALVQVLNLAADPDLPGLRPVLTGLPVASFNGTLSERVADGAGSVRAKTGTLTGVTSLAGTVTGEDGVTYVFAALANDFTDTVAARSAMDAVAAAIAG